MPHHAGDQNLSTLRAQGSTATEVLLDHARKGKVFRQTRRLHKGISNYRDPKSTGGGLFGPILSSKSEAIDLYIGRVFMVGPATDAGSEGPAEAEIGLRKDGKRPFQNEQSDLT